ncbi:S-adenosyl-L-methionine-dependent methyltransferase [Aspergillus avenaceus]|uniref:S-adenosyl-L-methionine-dependent methyltransferase n=1 Tax=Aspergillus avenaceus TaxID=36643 RepID=A0A5N6U4B0_ASPAV|nr:S-adenosyl-L-methionine-dependent methyltransferase [Aspergillus avenaceus]
MSDNPEEIVKNAYENITTWYLNWTTTQKSPRETYTQALLTTLQSQTANTRPQILELGCGPGVPITQLLAKSAAVTANDISPKQIALARARCPTATLIPGNMTGLAFEDESFHGAVSFYTLFHLPRGQLGDMLRRVYGWLKPGGVFALNLATVDEEEIHGEMLGYGMFWSSFDVAGNRALLESVGFEVVKVEVLGAGDGSLEEGDPDYEAEFMWVLARKGFS